MSRTWIMHRTCSGSIKSFNVEPTWKFCSFSYIRSFTLTAPLTKTGGFKVQAARGVLVYKTAGVLNDWTKKTSGKSRGFQHQPPTPSVQLELPASLTLIIALRSWACSPEWRCFPRSLQSLLITSDRPVKIKVRSCTPSLPPWGTLLTGRAGFLKRDSWQARRLWSRLALSPSHVAQRRSRHSACKSAV